MVTGNELFMSRHLVDRVNLTIEFRFQVDNPHATLGAITTLICFFQPIGAFFRPHPGSKRRPLFNWTHWLGGNTAHIMALVTIFFAVKLGKAELPEWMDWILVAFVIFHVISHLLLTVRSHLFDLLTREILFILFISPLKFENLISFHRLWVV